MKIKAINNYCMIEMLPFGATRIGNIELPENNSKVPRWGKILSVGPGVPDVNGEILKPDIEADQMVYVAAHGQYEVFKTSTLENDNLVVASVNDILAVLEDRESMTIKPLGNYVEIEKIELPEKNEFGIELTDNRKPPTNLGIVKALGFGWRSPEGSRIPFDVKVGDKIIFQPFRTVIVDCNALGKDEKKHLIMHSDIIGIVEEE